MVIILTGLTYIWLDNTSLALTDVTTLTIRVSDTLRATPSDRVGLRDEAGLAPTDWVALHGEGEWVTNTSRDSNLTSKVDRTDGSRAAGTRNTRVGLLHTSLTLTDVAALTIRVSDTLRATPSDSVGFGDKAGLTSTDGVTGPGQSTVGSRTTGRWVTGLQTVYESTFLETLNLHRAPRHTSGSDR